MPYVGRTPTPSPVTIDDIPANSIDASKIVDGSIEVSDIKDNSITDAKLNSTKLDGIADSANNYSHPAAHTVSEVTGLQGLLDGKTTETYVNTQVAALVASSPATLDTLNELAAALGNDANYAATVTTALAGKVDDSQVLTNVPSGAVFTDTDTTYSAGSGMVLSGTEFSVGELSEGKTINNINNINTNTTTVVNSDRNHILIGDITVSGSATWNITGTGELHIITF